MPGPALQPAVIGGLIGGGFVGGSVVLAEFLTRVRDRRQRLEEGFWAAGVAVDRVVDVLSHPRGATPGRMSDPVNEASRELAVVRPMARFPLRRARDIREEIEATIVRLQVAAMEWLLRGSVPAEQLQAIMGSRLAHLLYGRKEPTIWERVDAALVAKGLPPTEEFRTLSEDKILSWDRPPPE